VKILALIPTFNERTNVGPLIRRLLGLPELDLGVLVIDDFSPDGTGREVENIRRSHPDRVDLIVRNGARGLGRAYRDGFRFALSSGADRVVCMDADFSHEPEDVPRLLAACKDHDLVIGSRYVPGGEVRNWPTSRILLSRWANRYVRLITRLPVFDATSGFKALCRPVVEALALDRIASEGYSFQIELHYLVYRAGFRILEIPIVFNNREIGTSKMSRGVMAEAVLMPWRLVRDDRLSRLPIRDLQQPPGRCGDRESAPDPPELP